MSIRKGKKRVVVMNVRQNIKQLLYALEKQNKVDVQYSVVYSLKINGEYERYVSELDVMKRLMQVYKVGC